MVGCCSVVLGWVLLKASSQLPLPNQFCSPPRSLWDADIPGYLSLPLLKKENKAPQNHNQQTPVMQAAANIPDPWVRLETALQGVLSQGISEPQRRFCPAVGVLWPPAAAHHGAARRFRTGRGEKPEQDCFSSSEHAPAPSLGCKERSIQNCTAAWSNSKIVSLDYNVPIFQIYGHFQYYSLWP